MSGVDDEIALLKRAAGVELDRQLAIALDLDPTAIAAWRRRGRVPERYKLRYSAERAEVSNSQEVASDVGVRRTFAFSLLMLISSKISAQSEFKEAEEDDFMLAFEGMRLGFVYDRLVLEFSNLATVGAVKSRYQEIKDDILSTDISAWLGTVTRHHLEGQ